MKTGLLVFTLLKVVIVIFAFGLLFQRVKATEYCFDPGCPNKKRDG